MHTTPSNGASSAPSTSFPTTAQVYQGQLQDYELLLSVLREKVGSLAHFSQTLLRPRTFSPLDQENETGQIALQQLLEDPDYRVLCQNKKVSPYYLIVTMKDGAFVYETSNREGADKTELTLTGNAKWQALRTRIEKSLPSLGGQIRYDRLVSAPRIATFYGMAPWDPVITAEHQAAIDALEEKIASYQLGLEEDFNILDLMPGFMKKIRQVSLQSALSADSKDEMDRQFMTGEIKKAIQTFLPDGVTSLLAHLASDILVAATPEQIRNQPTVFLQKILQSPEARKLGDLLLTTMDWYGGIPGEETSPHMLTRVVANALQIWFNTRLIDYPDRIAGYDLQSSSNWGKSYKDIWRAFETHLLTSKRASSEKEAIIMARLFLCQFPAEFRIADIPIDLPYRGSPVWVNFVNGVNLINSTDPKALYRKTFQQLVNLPLKLSDGATKEQLADVSLARLLPTVDWAITQGVIPQKQYEKYTNTEVERAVSELDKYINALNDALIKLNKATPERLSIAKTIVENYLHVLNDEGSANSTFWNEHKLAQIPPGGYLNPQQYVIERYSVIDVVAEDKLESRKPWSIFKNNGLLTEYSISIDEHRQLQVGGSLLFLRSDTFPNVKKLFEQGFKTYITSLTGAYETLIKSLLTSLPFSDRQALELGKLSVYTLRKRTYRVEAKHETPEIILPRRSRNGLFLITTFRGVTRTFELIPRAGVIRRIDNLDSNLFGGILRYENWPSGGMNPNSVKTLDHQTLPFDWTAHSTGSTPRNSASCEAIIEQLGHPFMASTSSMENDSVALTINSKRCLEISHFIATELLFVDPKALHESAYGQTQFERDEASQKRLDEFLKSLVPFWKSIEDITSDDLERQVNGSFGLSMDLAAFALPIGKLASGSTNLINNAGRLTVRARLTAFATLTKEVSTLALQALNPLDLVGTLLKALGSGGLKLAKFGIFKIKAMAGKAGQYNFVESLPQIHNPGRWRPLASGDELATVRGIGDVPVRKIASATPPHYRLIDPVSGKPYGPSLAAGAEEVTLGRSAYRPLEKTDQHSIVEVAENARVREVLEVDGRTTLFVDDIPYRLDGDQLRRADLIDDSSMFKSLPCRVRRALGGEICKTSYVTRNPAPTPAIGSHDESKGWAPWFGDSIFTPAITGRTLLRKTLNYHGRLTATMEFQKGIYGRIKARISGRGSQFDTCEEGAIIVPAMDGSKRYVFTRLGAGNFYVAERLPGQSVSALLILRKAQTLPDDLAKELTTVYTGSLNANNMARIYGIDKVERAIKAMDEIAIPIGSHVNPPDTLKLIKVDTSPAEAALFDHSTRMIIRSSTDGAASWSLSRNAPDSVRETTAEVFNALFKRTVITVDSTQAGAKALKIDDTMMQLQKIISKKKGRPLNRPRNIAFAEIKTKAGVREIYVSVSGSKGDTGFLPLFKPKANRKEVTVDGTRYINIDGGTRFPETALNVTPENKLLAIPHTIEDIEKYTPALTLRPTSLDTESKLISVIRAKYPDPKDLDSITIATTLAPCDSCSIVMKQFGYDGSPDALNVIWK